MPNGSRIQLGLRAPLRPAWNGLFFPRKPLELRKTVPKLMSSVRLPIVQTWVYNGRLCLAAQEVSHDVGR